MKIVVIGGSGLIGKRLVTLLRGLGHEAVPEVIDLGLLYDDALVLDGGVRIDPRDLLRLCEPRVADISLRRGDRSPWRSGRRRPSA